MSRSPSDWAWLDRPHGHRFQDTAVWWNIICRKLECIAVQALLIVTNCVMSIPPRRSRPLLVTQTLVDRQLVLVQLPRPYHSRSSLIMLGMYCPPCRAPHLRNPIDASAQVVARGVAWIQFKDRQLSLPCRSVVRYPKASGKHCKYQAVDPAWSGARVAHGERMSSPWLVRLAWRTYTKQPWLCSTIDKISTRLAIQVHVRHCASVAQQRVGIWEWRLDPTIHSR